MSRIYLPIIFTRNRFYLKRPPSLLIYKKKLISFKFYHAIATRSPLQALLLIPVLLLPPLQLWLLSILILEPLKAIQTEARLKSSKLLLL